VSLEEDMIGRRLCTWSNQKVQNRGRCERPSCRRPRVGGRHNYRL